MDRSRLQRRVEHRYLDEIADDLDSAVANARGGQGRAPGLSIGVVGNCAEVLPELLRRGVAIDIVTDQTSRPRPAVLPAGGRRLEDWHDYAAAKPEEFTDRARASMARQVEAMVGFQDAGAEVFDYGNSIRDEARQGGYDAGLRVPGVRAGLHPAAVLRGQGAVPLGRAVRRPEGHPRHGRGRAGAVPGQRQAAQVDARRPRNGSPSRACRPGSAGSATASGTRPGWRFNDLVASGAVGAPIVIGRDHLDCGSVASPYRETEAMADGSDAIADWPLLNALVNTASGATLGVDPPRRRGRYRPLDPRRAGSVADGTALAAQKLERVLTQRPGMGVHPARRRRLRPAVDVAAERGVRVPMRESALSAQRERCGTIVLSTRSFDRQWAELAAGRPPRPTGGYRRYA